MPKFVVSDNLLFTMIYCKIILNIYNILKKFIILFSTFKNANKIIFKYYYVFIYGILVVWINIKVLEILIFIKYLK